MLHRWSRSVHFVARLPAVSIAAEPHSGQPLSSCTLHHCGFGADNLESNAHCGCAGQQRACFSSCCCSHCWCRSRLPKMCQMPAAAQCRERSAMRLLSSVRLTCITRHPLRQWPCVMLRQILASWWHTNECTPNRLQTLTCTPYLVILDV